MPNCAQCGAAYESEDRYCPQCGRRLSLLEAEGGVNTQKPLDILEVQYKLGMVYFKKGDYQRAAEALGRVLRERPDDADLKRLVRDARSRIQSAGAQG